MAGTTLFVVIWLDLTTDEVVEEVEAGPATLVDTEVREAGEEFVPTGLVARTVVTSVLLPNRTCCTC